MRAGERRVRDHLALGDARDARAAGEPVPHAIGLRRDREARALQRRRRAAAAKKSSCGPGSTRRRAPPCRADAAATRRSPSATPGSAPAAASRSPACSGRPPSPPSPLDDVRRAAAEHRRDVDAAVEGDVRARAGAALAEAQHAPGRAAHRRRSAGSALPSSVAPRSAPVTATMASAARFAARDRASVTSSVAARRRCRRARSRDDATPRPSARSPARRSPDVPSGRGPGSSSTARAGRR